MSYIDIFENFIASQPAINDFITYKKLENYYLIEFHINHETCTAKVYSDHLFSEDLSLKTQGLSFWDDLDELKRTFRERNIESSKQD